MMQNPFRKHGDDAVVIIIFLVILLFIFSYVPLDLVFTKTIISGGDTPSHYYAASYFKDYLAPQLKIIGWSQGWYAGFPMFQFYFPLPFILIALLGLLLPLQIAFKLVTLLAIISLPFAAYALFRLLRFPKLVAITGATFTLPFLFMEAQSMWGGNILSTFAGEFSYALGIALSLVYLGLLHEGISSGRHLLKNSLLLAVIGFTHVYTLLWVITASLFLLISSDVKKRLAYWFQVNAIAFLLLGFWMIPLVYYLQYTTSLAIAWKFGSWQDFFPKLLWPFAVLALIGIVYCVRQKEKRIMYLLFSAALSVIFYFIAFDIGVVDIRFIPFIQLLLLFVAAYPLVLLYQTKLRGTRLIPIILLLLTILWAQANVVKIPDWAQWNYKGMENKRLWEQYSGVNEFLKGDENDPRVVYEHSTEHNAAGSIRAFELLPLLSGRSTLEGLYLQSSPTSPFVFYIQSEISKSSSCPFPSRKCAPFNMTAGTEHLKLFNVKHFIAVTEPIKNALRKHGEYKLVFEKKPYEVYELTTNEDAYVVVPEYKPIFFPRKNWQISSYNLFRQNYDVPIVFDVGVREEPNITKVPMNQSCNIKSEVKKEEIYFTTDCVGQPHLVKVSYFPRWKSENGEKIHLVSPSFMLIYPEQEQVRLYFGRTWIENTSLLLSLLGWIALIGYRPLKKYASRAQKGILQKLQPWLF